ncbi:hypothetical protein GVAV_000101 [Gurleya vavrai]
MQRIKGFINKKVLKNEKDKTPLTDVEAEAGKIYKSSDDANKYIQNVKKKIIYLYSICTGIILLVADFFFFICYRYDTKYEENYSHFIYYMLVMTIIMTLTFNFCLLRIKYFCESNYPKMKIGAVSVALCTFLIIWIFYGIIIYKYKSLYNVIKNEFF